jgi:hypothetical protein
MTQQLSVSRAAPVRTLLLCAWAWSVVVFAGVLLQAPCLADAAVGLLPALACALASLSLRVPARSVGLIVLSVSAALVVAALARIATPLLAVMPTSGLLGAAALARLAGER